jgi:hypothetical protein
MKASSARIDPQLNASVAIFKRLGACGDARTGPEGRWGTSALRSFNWPYFNELLAWIDWSRGRRF